MQAQWEDRLAAYVRTSFEAEVLGASARTPSNTSARSTTALILFVGAEAVIDGDMTVGALIAFNMIVEPGGGADPAAVAALAGFPAGAGLGRAARRHPQRADRSRAPRQLHLPPLARRDRVANITFRYRPDAPDVLEEHRLSTSRPARSSASSGRSGSGKSTTDQARSSGSTCPQTGRCCSTASTSRRSTRLAATADRRRAAGEHPLQSHDPRQHRARRSRHAAQPS